jgi:hypothetical protein
MLQGAHDPFTILGVAHIEAHMSRDKPAHGELPG